MRSQGLPFRREKLNRSTHRSTQSWDWVKRSIALPYICNYGKGIGGGGEVGNGQGRGFGRHISRRPRFCETQDKVTKYEVIGQASSRLNRQSGR